IPEKNAILHHGGWVKSAADSYEVRGKTLGIIGYGHIGTQIGVLAEHLGMRVLFTDIEAKLPLGNAQAMNSLEALLGAADVVTLHVPETAETAGMMGAAQLAAMKPGSHLINASRGSVVDIDALAAALQSRHLHGAAIDVFPIEPQGNDSAFVSPLTRFDNVILTPHIGGSTLEAQVNIGTEVAAKLIRYSSNGSTTSAVNFPEVALPAHTGRSRLLHIHRNVPGVMAQVNERLSAAGINIAAQYLSTHEDVGYVVIDVDSAASKAALDELCDVPYTIRCRILY
ncbi:MAG: phosphoglycerate dehydrogenase, partial [Rhodoferax sp.]|nr:phosphoglycerate dehydrogenase [Rhodoferax sp.]